MSCHVMMIIYIYNYNDGYWNNLFIYLAIFSSPLTFAFVFIFAYGKILSEIIRIDKKKRKSNEAEGIDESSKNRKNKYQ